MPETGGYFLIEGLEIHHEPRHHLRVGPLAAYATAASAFAVVEAQRRIGFDHGETLRVSPLDVETLVAEHGAAAALSQRGLLASFTCIVAWPAKPYPGAPVVRWFLPDGAATFAPGRVVAGWTPVGGRVSLVALTPEEEIAFNASR